MKEEVISSNISIDKKIDRSIEIQVKSMITDLICLFNDNKNFNCI
jgi:hypothetical protein